MVSIDERGVVFRSYRDGSLIELTPESSVRAQKDIGADIIIPLDELPSHHVTPDALAESVSLSHRWMCRSLREHLRDPAGQAMYGVVHGGTDRDLRRSSVEYLSSLPFDGMAIGGSLGKDRGDMIDMLRYMTPLLPPDRPRHLLGIGDPTSVAAAVPLGIDTFDSCLPTRVARHGTLFLRRQGSGGDISDGGEALQTAAWSTARWLVSAAISLARNALDGSVAMLRSVDELTLPKPHANTVTPSPLTRAAAATAPES